MDNTVFKKAEETCKDLKNGIDYVNKEIAKLEGSKSTYEANIEAIKKSCEDLGIKVEDLETIITQGEEKLTEIIEEAEEVINKIEEIKSGE